MNMVGSFNSINKKKTIYCNSGHFAAQAAVRVYKFANFFSAEDAFRK